MAKHPLTPEEEALWKEVTGGDKKLSTKKKHSAPDSAIKTHKVTVQKRIFIPRTLKAGEIAPEPKQKGQYAGIDKNTAARFRKGKYPIDATLDLHGMTAPIARQHVAHFLNDARHAGIRCVRIIHGKGRGSSNKGPVLKVKLNTWLRQRHDVLAYCSARPQDGGTGAAYVLLKR